MDSSFINFLEEEKKTNNTETPNVYHSYTFKINKFDQIHFLSGNESAIYIFKTLRDKIYKEYVRQFNKSKLNVKIFLVDLLTNKIITESTLKINNERDLRNQSNKIINLTRDDYDSLAYFQQPGKYAVFFIRDKNNLKPKKLIQKYLDNQNDTSKHCFFDPILVHLSLRYKEAKTDKTRKNISCLFNTATNLKKQYSNGVEESNIKDIADKLNVNIIIKDLFDNIQFQYTKYKQKTFYYTNVYKNHLEISLCQNSKAIVTVDNQQEMINILNNHQYAIYTKNERLNTLHSISTSKYIYQYTNPSREAMREHIKQIKDLSIDAVRYPFLTNFLRSGNNVSNAINYKNPKTFQSLINKHSVKYIDQIKSYAQFKNCNYYQGFPNRISQFRKVNIKSNQIKNFLKQNQGVFRVKILNNTNLDNNTRQHFNKLQYAIPHKQYSFTSPELLFLHDLGIQFQITHGAYSTKTYHLNVTDQMLNLKEQIHPDQKPVSMYKILFGKLGYVPNTEKLYTKVTKEMAENIINNNEYNKNAISYINNELSIEKPVKYAPHFVHMAAYIPAYSRIQVLQQLIKFNYKDTIRMNLDGLYVIDRNNLSNEDFQDKYLDNTFTIKEFSSIHDQSSNELFTNYIDTINLPTADPRDLSHINFNLGPGGSGKTFYNITDKGLIDTLFVAPSWKLATSKRDEYLKYNGYSNLDNYEKQLHFPITTLQKLSGQDGYKYEFKQLQFHTLKEIKEYYLKDFNVKLSTKDIKNNPTFKDLRNTTNKYSCKPYYFDNGFPANIIIDECSMISSSRLHLIYKQYSNNSNIILCGDINYQLNPISGDTIKINDYDFSEDYGTLGKPNIEYFNTDYRSKDDTIKKLKLKLREYITDCNNSTRNITKSQECRICSKVAAALVKDKILRTISPVNVKHLYDYTKDIILCRTHREKDTWNNEFQDKPKYYVVRQGKILDKYHYNGEIIIYEKHPDEIPSNIINRHGYTVHSIQGETFTGRIFIDIREQKFDFKMFYTAISRAKKIDQLYLII